MRLHFLSERRFSTLVKYAIGQGLELVNELARVAHVIKGHGGALDAVDSKNAMPISGADGGESSKFVGDLAVLQDELAFVAARR